MLDLYGFVQLTLDPVRLAVLGRAAVRPVVADELAAEIGVPLRAVLEGIGKLRSAGLLTAELTLDRATLRDLGQRLPRMPPADPAVTDGGAWDEEEVEVLMRFFSADRLTAIPTGRAKRRVVLERLAQEFEPGIRYGEQEVNFTLQMWNPDYASLRRYLVDEGFMTRADGVYWRTGGRYEPQSSGSD